MKGTQQALQRMTSSFDGTKIIKEATLAAAAVEKIGGVSRLTADEQRKLSGTVDEAFAKYHALGQTAPADLHLIRLELRRVQEAEEAATAAAAKLEKGVGGVGSAASSIGSAFTSMVGALTFDRALGAAISFGQSIVDLGGEIDDLSNRTGIGAEAIQELRYAAVETGTSIDTIAGSIDQMSNRLTEGSKGTTAALSQMGLSLDDLRAKSPESAFMAITDAIQQVPDPMRQTQLAMELFGKSGTQILPAIREGFEELRQKAHDMGAVISDANVKALAEFGDKWDATMLRLKASSATATLDIGRGFEKLFADLKAGLSKAVPDTVESFFTSDAMKTFATRLATNMQGGFSRVVIEEAKKRQQADGQAGLDKLRDQVLRDRSNSIGDVAPPSKAVPDADLKSVVNYREEHEKLIKVAAETARRIELFGGSTRLTKGELSDANRVLQAGLEVLAAEGRSTSDLAKRLEDMARSTREVIRPSEDFRDILRNLSLVQMPDLSKVTEKTAGTTQALSREWIHATDMFQLTGNVGLKSMRSVHDQTVETHLKTQDLSASLGGMSRAFADLAQVHPLDGWIKDAAELINLMHVASQSGSGLAAVLTKTTKDGDTLSTSFDFSKLNGSQGAGNTIAAYAQLAQAGVGAYSAVKQSTEGGGAAGVAKGALTGASIGANPALLAATGGWSVVIGAGVGAIVGALRKGEQEIGRVANEFGVSISKDLAKQIDKMKGAFGGDRFSAEVFNLDAIIGEAGGLKTENFDRLAGKLRDTFSLLEQGKFSSADTINTLSKNFGTFAAYVEKSNDLIGTSFTDVLELAKREGMTSADMEQFVSGQIGRAGAGLQSLMAPLKELADAQAVMKDLDAQAIKVRGGKSDADLGVGDKEALAAIEAQRAQAKQLTGDTADLTAQMERFGIIAVGAFNGAQKSGLDTLLAVAQLSPALDEYLQLQRDLGITVESSGIAQLTQYRDLVQAHQGLVSSAQGLNEVLLAINNTGGLTPEVLAAIEEQGDETFEKLTAAGFSQNQALELMKDELKNVREAHEKLGIPIDENTSKLIELAEKQGLLAENDPTKLMKENFDTLTGAVGLLAKGLGVDVPNNIQRLIDKLNDIPATIDTTYRVSAEYPNDFPIPPGSIGETASGAYRGGYVTARGMQYLERGGMVGYRPFGMDTVPAMLSPGEGVLNSSRGMRNLARLNLSDVTPTGRSSGSVTTVRIPIEIDSRQVAEAVLKVAGRVLAFKGAT